MCLSVANAEFRSTILYAGIGTLPVTHQPVHVVGYQNLAINLAEAANGESLPNAMLLLLPAKGAFGQNNFLDMRPCRSVLDDMVTALDNDGMLSLNVNVGRGTTTAEVFEHDIYTVVVAEHASSIPAALERVPTHKRPTLTAEMYAYLAKVRDRRIVLCCFDNRDAQRAAPLFAWYEPIWFETLLAPAIDGHDGKAPAEGDVEVDHRLIFGTSDPTMHGAKVHYRDPIPEAYRTLLPAVVAGTRVQGRLPNGDFVTLVEDQMGSPNPKERVLRFNGNRILRTTPDEPLDQLSIQRAFTP